MTSGRLKCSDCGNNAPQGRHAYCEILAMLRGSAIRAISSAQIRAEVFGGHDPYGYRTYRAIRRLRDKGYRISTLPVGPRGEAVYKLGREAVS